MLHTITTSKATAIAMGLNRPGTRPRVAFWRPDVWRLRLVHPARSGNCPHCRNDEQRAGVSKNCAGMDKSEASWEELGDFMIWRGHLRPRHACRLDCSSPFWMATSCHCLICRLCAGYLRTSFIINYRYQIEGARATVTASCTMPLFGQSRFESEVIPVLAI